MTTNSVTVRVSEAGPGTVRVEARVNGRPFGDPQAALADEAIMQAAAAMSDTATAAGFVYAEAARQVRGLRERVRDERQAHAQERVDACPEHRAVHTSDERPYTGGVATRIGEDNRAAHGGVHVVETCRCGAVRGVLVNGRHTEHGGWRAPRVD